jgi:hypothetical protein
MHSGGLSGFVLNIFQLGVRRNRKYWATDEQMLFQCMRNFDDRGPEVREITAEIASPATAYVYDFQEHLAGYADFT